MHRSRIGVGDRPLTPDVVIYPTMIATLFSTDIVYGGLLSTAIGGGTAAGQFGGSLIATPGGHMRWKLIIVTACLTAFVGGMAGAKQNQAVASALITLGSASLGAIEALAIGVVTIVIDDQKEMGVASGVFSSLRSVGGVIASKSRIRDVLTIRCTNHPAQLPFMWQSSPTKLKTTR